jgi:hypothetical protein
MGKIIAVITLVKLMYNKNIMVGILLAGKALPKSPYIKRYVRNGNIYEFA